MLWLDRAQLSEKEKTNKQKRYNTSQHTPKLKVKHNSGRVNISGNVLVCFGSKHAQELEWLHRPDLNPTRNQWQKYVFSCKCFQLSLTEFLILCKGEW